MCEVILVDLGFREQALRVINSIMWSSSVPLADQYGFDMVFAMAQCLRKGGFGDGVRFREQTPDLFIRSAGLALLTSNALPIASVRFLCGRHPL